MRSVILYISVSLDGYIADGQGRVDWLDTAAGMVEDNGYDGFVKGVDTVVMGRKTYDQVTTELSPEQWPYEGLMTYVLTHRPSKPEGKEKINFYNGTLSLLLKGLKESQGKDIWLCGGADLVRQAIEEDLIDRYHLTVMPVLLGQGIRLFGKEEKTQYLRLVSHRSIGEMLECIYEKR